MALPWGLMLLVTLQIFTGSTSGEPSDFLSS